MNNRRGGLLLLGAATAATAVLLARSPVPGAYPPCIWRALTGYDCPFCGGLRATSALAHGQLATAADFNLLVTIGVPLTLILALLAVAAGPRSQPLFAALTSRPGLFVVAGVALGFMLLRMMPFAGWLTSAG